jgi:hypothetical protein
MVLHAWVLMPDGIVRHARYDSVVDETTRFLCDDPQEAFETGWAMEWDYDPAWDGKGVPVLVATDYDDSHWAGTAYREPGSDWWWLTGGNAPTDDVVRHGLPAWAANSGERADA